MTVSEMFSQAIQLEEKEPERAALLYIRLLDEEPKHAAAHVNLGTLYYNRNDFTNALSHYMKCLEIDPDYALAHFDIANVYDEIGKPDQALMHYERAVQLAPTYADAHYNLALLQEKLSQPRKALLHWKAYIKQDFSSAWADHARKRIKMILASDPLKVVRSSTNPKRTKRRARLCLAYSSFSPLTPRRPKSQSTAPLNSGA